MSFSNLQALNALQSRRVTTGERQTLGKGDMITFSDLPNQPIVLVAYNNTGNTTPYVVSYNNEAPNHFTIDSVQAQGFSLGNAFFLDPSKTGSREISVSVPVTAQGEASIDVYLVSLYLPTTDIYNQEIPLDGRQVQFDGYSRAYATPPLAWYNLNITSKETGLVGFLFNTDSVTTIVVNAVKDSVEASLKLKIYGDEKKTGLAPTSPIIKQGNSYSHDFYGTSTQFVYSPVSSAKTTQNGMISIQKT